MMVGMVGIDGGGGEVRMSGTFGTVGTGWWKWQAFVILACASDLVNGPDPELFMDYLHLYMGLHML